MDIHSDFFKLFRKREYTELLGVRNKNFIMLMAIGLVTFTAIGFSNGSINYLAQKMKSPFVNWVNISVPYELAESSVKFKNELDNEQIRNEYAIRNITAYNETPMNFWDIQKKGTSVAVGRSIEINDPVLDEIYSSRNLIYGRRFDNEQDIGFIVTKSLLKDFGYNEKTPFVYWRFKESDTSYRNIPIPIVAVVKELPGRHNFAMTPYMYAVIWENPINSPFNPYGEKELYCFTVIDDEEETEKIHETIRMYFDEHHGNISPFLMPAMKNQDSYHEGFIIKITFSPKPDNLQILDNIYDSMIAHSSFDKFRPLIYRYHSYSARLPGYISLERYHYLSLNFANLSKIRDFSDYLFIVNPDFKIDFAQVESKENYDFISRLTLIISFILILFSVYAISLFLSNVLRMHLEKISVNLGTLMAFGVDNMLLRKLYLQITLRFVGIAMLISLLLSALLGYTNGLRLMLRIFSTGIESGENYYSILNLWTLLTVIAIFITVYMAVSKTLKNLFRNTPGDLVYERT